MLLQLEEAQAACRTVRRPGIRSYLRFFEALLFPRHMKRVYDEAE